MGIESKVFSKAVAAQHLIRCIVELSPLCNLSCEMCGISLTADEAKCYGQILSKDEWMKLLDQLADAGVLFLTISGGEPLIYPGFEELYLYARRKGFVIDIRTNGMQLPRYQELLRAYPPKQISISVYGSSDEMYRRMTGIANGFTQLVKALDSAKYIGCPLHLTCTMTKTNVECFMDVAQLAEKYNATFGMITDIFPHVRGIRQNTITRLSPAECAAIAFYPPKDVKKALEVARAIEKAYADRFDVEVQNQKTELHMCASCQIAACIKWDGRMTFCPELESIYSKPLVTGIEEAWKNLLYQRTECTVPNDQCRRCGIRQYCTGACPARFHLETGSYMVPCRHVCETAYYKKLLHKLEGDLI